jgi:hypothetical protein
MDGANFGLDEPSARDFLELMTARHALLFPPGIQPRGTSFMLIRKEERHLIRPIEEARIRLSQIAVPPDPREVELFTELRRLDALVGQGAEWDAIETLLSSIKETFEDVFQAWLMAKGIEASLADDLAACLAIWLDFIYAYGQDEDTPLCNVPPSSWLEFFHGYLLRKLMTEPPAYVNRPSALILFYRYLQDRGYLDSSREAENAIRRIELEFYDLLRKEFS